MTRKSLRRDAGAAGAPEACPGSPPSGTSHAKLLGDPIDQTCGVNGTVSSLDMHRHRVDSDPGDPMLANEPDEMGSVAAPRVEHDIDDLDVLKRAVVELVGAVRIQTDVESPVDIPRRSAVDAVEPVNVARWHGFILPLVPIRITRRITPPAVSWIAGYPAGVRGTRRRRCVLSASGTPRVCEVAGPPPIIERRDRSALNGDFDFVPNGIDASAHHYPPDERGGEGC